MTHDDLPQMECYDPTDDDTGEFESQQFDADAQEGE